MTGQQDSQDTPDVSSVDEHTDGERADDEREEGRRDDDSPVERYRDSPGIGMFDDDIEPPEPNEPA